MRKVSFFVVFTVFFALACFVMANHAKAAGNTAEAKALVDKAVSTGGQAAGQDQPRVSRPGTV